LGLVKEDNTSLPTRGNEPEVAVVGEEADVTDFRFKDHHAISFVENDLT